MVRVGRACISGEGGRGLQLAVGRLLSTSRWSPLPPALRSTLAHAWHERGRSMVWGGFGPDHTVPSTPRPLTGTYNYLLTYLLTYDPGAASWA